MEQVREFPFRGSVIWLTPAQGGRTTGPPPPRPAWPYYTAMAYVPPHTADTGLGSFILRNFDDGARRSSAEGRWLLTNKTISWAKGRESMSDYSGTYMNMRG